MCGAGREPPDVHWTLCLGKEIKGIETLLSDVHRASVGAVSLTAIVVFTTGRMETHTTDCLQRRSEYWRVSDRYSAH